MHRLDTEVTNAETSQVSQVRIRVDAVREEAQAVRELPQSAVEQAVRGAGKEDMMVVALRVTDIADGMVAAECSNGGVCVSRDYKEVLWFLTHETGYCATPRMVWSLRDAVPVIAGMLPKVYRDGLLAGKGAVTWTEDGVRYRLYLQRSTFDEGEYKFFAANVRREQEAAHEINVYELDQFFPDDRGPMTVAAVQSAADALVECYESLGVRNVTKFISPLAVAEDGGLLGSLWKELPEPEGIPAEVRAYAVDVNSVAVWRGAYQVGYFPEVHGYDVASCYPGQASRLVHLGGAEYRHSKKMLEGATYGFLNGTMHIDPKHPMAWASPIGALVSSGQTCPVGSWKDTFTLEQVRWVESRGLGSFELKDGWFVFAKREDRPFESIMRSLFAQRQRSPLMDMVVKRIIAGIIGRLGEYHDDMPTERTNTVYHALIRTGASLQVGSFLFDNQVGQGELVHVNTDGVYLTRAIEGLPTAADMGCWRYSGVHRLLVLSTHRTRKDDACDYLLDEIKAEPNEYRYRSAGGVHLFSLEGEQDRLFKKFPETGRELVARPVVSAPRIARLA